MTFEFATAKRIVFGEGSLQQIGKITAGLGRDVLVIHGLAGDGFQQLVNLLEKENLRVTSLRVQGEPELHQVEHYVQVGRQAGVTTVIGFGGGSALDAAKATAAMLANAGDLLDYLEVVGKGQSLHNPALPWVAIPTTAGTGSEVTRNAVLSVPEKKVKVSLRSAGMLASVALIDPLLTLSLPPAVTASTGMDALAQVLEPFVSRRANPMTDIFCRDGMACSARSLRRAYFDGGDVAARTELCRASLMGGLALANAGLGAVHGFAAPIGGMFNAPHGAICARLLPLVTRANIDAFRKRAPESPVIGRYDEAARILTGDPVARADDGVAWLTQLCADLEIPGLGQYGVQTGDLKEIVHRAREASSMKANPLDLTETELVDVLEAAL